MWIRCFIATTLVMGGIVQAGAGDLGWSRYTNARFGASADIPMALFVPERAPDDGDGQSFQSGEDAAIIRVYGSLYSATADSFFAYARSTIAEAANDGLTVTYKTSGSAFFVYCGLKRDRIVYSKTIFGCKDVAETVEIEYPASSKSLYDPLVARIAGSLKAQAGLECK